ncbi:MAG: OmpA family protein [Bacteroidales bacterium]|nr:OmpA family protein [Bacteroidales bacterium]
MTLKNVYSLIIILLLLLNFNIVSFADNDLSGKAKYKQAEELLAFDNFDKALELYFELYNDNNQNFNYVYKIGYCYLAGENKQNIPTAIDYFLLASENVDKNYKNKYKENKAPVNTLYYLGVAYRLNKDFEKAIDAFNAYKQKMSRKDRKTIPGMFIDREIQSCSDAMEVIDTERMKIEKIVVNGLQEPNVRCPILCWEANRLIFTNGKYNVFPPDINYNTEYSEGPFDGVYMAERNEDGTFFNPQKISADLQISYPFIPVTATADGSELYLVADCYDNGDIYVSKFEDGKYQPAQKVKKLNSRKWESHATITADGQRIYFTSLRRGGEGGLDIWYSDRDEDGKWKKPINAGPEINTPFHEEMPYVIRNGNALYFSSESHTNVGGFDVFYTSKDEQNKKWTSPVNLGYPFSTAGNDMGYVIENTPVFAFCPINDNKRRIGVEECDCISLVDEQAPQLASISGLISLNSEDQEKLMQFRVKLVDVNDGKEIANVQVNENGNYFIEGIKAGNYEIIAYDNEAYLMSRTIEIPQNEKWDITGLNITVEITDLVSTDNTENVELASTENIIVDNSQIVGIKNVFFDNDSDVIDDKYTEDIKLVADYLKKHPEAKIEIHGYCSQTGPLAYNMQLSESRAKNLMQQIVQYGASETQIQINAYGYAKPIAINDFPDSRLYNRRTEIVFLNEEDNVNTVMAYVPTYYRSQNEPNYDNGKFFYCEVEIFNELVAEAVFFDFDKYVINAQYEKNLNIIADYLMNNPKAKFKLSGHTDHYGSDDYNLGLSQNRVVKVKDYLINKGVSDSQLEMEFLGEKENITIATDNDLVRRLNRRVNVFVLKQGETPIRVAPIIVPEEYKVKKN